MIPRDAENRRNVPKQGGTSKKSYVDYSNIKFITEVEEPKSVISGILLKTMFDHVLTSRQKSFTRYKYSRFES